MLQLMLEHPAVLIAFSQGIRLLTSKTVSLSMGCCKRNLIDADYPRPD